MARIWEVLPLNSISISMKGSVLTLPHHKGQVTAFSFRDEISNSFKISHDKAGLSRLISISYANLYLEHSQHDRLEH
jgi:hypothetical protein